MSSLGSPSTFFLAKKKAYEIERSLRVNDDDSAYLSRTPSSAGNRRTFTISLWTKRANFTGALFGSYISDADRATLRFTSDYLEFQSAGASVKTNAVFRDPSAWYHIVCAIDTTQGTQSNRGKLYVNGVQQELSSNNFSQDVETSVNNNSLHVLGTRWASGSANMLYDGYLAEVHLIDGSALTPSSFAETDVLTGEYKPKKYTGGYGTNGFYLNFSDNSGTTATTLGKDYSGNGNNFTPNNFSVAAGKDDDSSFDSPTNNFPTLSPISKSSEPTLTNGNLRWYYNYKPASKTVRATMALPSTGKIYMEWENEQPSSQGGRMSWGLVRYASQSSTYDYQAYNNVDYINISYGGSMWNGTTHVNPAWSSPPTFYSGERCALAIDCSNGKWWVGKVASNGTTTWYAADGGTDGDPAGGTNETATLPSFTTATEWIPFVGWHDGGGAVTQQFSANINFGNHSFLGTVPNGFEKLCSANLSDPSIAEGNKHFDTLLWTGNSTDNRAITGLNFQPDLTWIKRRSGGAQSHFWVDALRSNTDGSGGNGNVGPLATNDNYAETNTLTDGGFESFNSDGFTLGKGSSTANADAPYQRNNASGETYVGWNWKAGGSASSNSDGTITSSVSVNASAGFSIVTWTGTGSAGTIGHGLGVAPKWLVVKLRSGSQDWFVNNGMILNDYGKYFKWNSTNTAASDTNVFPNTAPTSTVFSVGTDSAVNASSSTYVAYVFSEVAGYSKFGSYEGNQSSDNGPFVYLGFTPAWIMIKNADNASNRQWCIIDATRTTINKSASAEVLFANDSQSESVANNNYGQFASKPAVDILSNGFKVREGETSAYTQTNRPNSHIYLAFAESPFKYARAR